MCAGGRIYATLSSPPYISFSLLCLRFALKQFDTEREDILSLENSLENNLSAFIYLAHTYQFCLWLFHKLLHSIYNKWEVALFPFTVKYYTLLCKEKRTFFVKKNIFKFIDSKYKIHFQFPTASYSNVYIYTILHLNFILAQTYLYIQ